MIFTESYYRMIIHGISDIFRETSLPARLTGREDYTGERGEMRMSTDALTLKQEFHISAVSSIQFFEYKSDFIFKSEYHDCWKLLYVEAGACEILRSGHKATPLSLQKGQLFIQAPNEYYSLKAAKEVTPLLFSCGFYCDSPGMSLLSNRIFSCKEQERRLLSALSEEGRSNFSMRVDDSALYRLERKLNQPFGGEQLIGMYLEMLLISLMRQYVSPAAEKDTAASSLSKADSILLNRITDYYAAHITEKLHIRQVCQEFSIGRSHLQRIFREQTGLGAMEYFCQMRIGAARQLIRENKMNLTDTARALGYTSIHYFSKQFKKITGMPPSQYQNSVRTADSDPVCQQIDLDQIRLIAKAPEDKDPLSS